MSNVDPGRGSKFRIVKLWYFVYGIILLNFSWFMWLIGGYLDIGVVVVIWALIVIAFFLIIYSIHDTGSIRFFRAVPFISFLLSLYVVMSLLSRTISTYGTDEIALSSYAAYLTLHGFNPYLDSNMANVFVYTGLPQNLITPLATGGAVHYFIYPALSIILFIPSILLHFPPYVIPLAFNILLFLVIYFYFKGREMENTTPLLVVAGALDVQYSISSITGVPDVMWVFFLVLSIVYVNRESLSGLFFGLSLAVKQMPALILPFYIYYLYREEGYSLKRILKFLGFLSLSFMIPNIPFIIAGPGLWFSHMLLAVNQPILGAGFGLSILSFTGLVWLPTPVYTVLFISAFFIFIYIYIVKFQKLRYGFFIFPVIIFMFNYRTLFNYIIYWPFFILILIPKIMSGRPTHSTKVRENRRISYRTYMNALREIYRRRKTFINFFVLSILISGASASAGYVYVNHSNENSPFVLENVTGFGDPYSIPNAITSLNLEVNYTPPYGGPVNLMVHYRIFINGRINSINALLWSSGEYLSPGVNNVTIYPNTYADFLPYKTSFVVEAYYGDFVSFVRMQAISPAIRVMFANPEMAYPTNSIVHPYPGWSLQFFHSPASYNLSYSQGGLNLLLPKTQGTPVQKVSLSAPFNFSYLSRSNLSLSYSIKDNINSPLNVSGGSLKSFKGIMLSFDGGNEKLYITREKIIGNRMIFLNRAAIILIQARSTINFSLVREIGKEYHWGMSDALFSYLVVYNSSADYLSVMFGNVTLSTDMGIQSVFGGQLLHAFEAVIHDGQSSAEFLRFKLNLFLPGMSRW